MAMNGYTQHHLILERIIMDDHLFLLVRSVVITILVCFSWMLCWTNKWFNDASVIDITEVKQRGKAIAFVVSGFSLAAIIIT